MHVPRVNFCHAARLCTCTSVCMHTCMHTHSDSWCTHKHMCVHVRAHAHVCVCMSACAFMHTFVHACMLCMCVRMCACAWVQACKCACACMRACVRACVRATGIRKRNPIETTSHLHVRVHACAYVCARAACEHETHRRYDAESPRAVCSQSSRLAEGSTYTRCAELCRGWRLAAGAAS